MDEHGHLMRGTRHEKHHETGADINDLDSDMSEDVRLEMPLGDGVLKVNLGIPLVVVVNKVDLL